jgi:pre-mRNA cleavage complex 2 protein Pcf11
MAALTESLSRTMRHSPVPDARLPIHGITLSADDLQRKRPEFVALLYDARARRCSQCGRRYDDTAQGRAALTTHMDFHFRMNRKLKEKTRKVLSQAWLATEDEWVRGSQPDEQAEAMVATSNTEDKAEAHMVPAPDEHTACTVCQESFETVWSDKDEEWMYANAVMEGGQVRALVVV